MKFLKLNYGALRGPLHDLDLSRAENRQALVLYEGLLIQHVKDPGFPYREVLIKADPAHLALALPETGTTSLDSALQIFAELGLLTEGETIEEEKKTA